MRRLVRTGCTGLEGDWAVSACAPRSMAGDIQVWNCGRVMSCSPPGRHEHRVYGANVDTSGSADYVSDATETS